ncbi:MAG: CHAT domain-containing protein [Dechloromonas sp.]|nr:CHAT domain-containing protein [Dechloromonas sp.]
MSIAFRFLKHGLAIAVLLAGSLGAVAQEEVEDDEGGVSGSMLAEQERIVQAPFPDAAEPMAQCVFLHKRAGAYFRLGRPEDGLSDLRRALEIQQKPEKATRAAAWCDRWRMQSMVSRGLRQIGDPQARLAHLIRMADEWRPIDLRRYFFTQAWLIDEYANLGMLRKAEETLRRAADLVPELRSQKMWATEESNILNQLTLYQAYYQVLNGNFPEAERYRRESLRHAEAYLVSVERRRAPDDPLRRIAAGNVTNALRLLANTLNAQGKFAEAEMHMRESLRRHLAVQSPQAPEVVRVINNFAVIKLNQGRIGEAEKLSRQALAALEGGQVKAASPLLADTRADLAFTLQLQDRWAESLALFDQRERGLRTNALQAGKSGILRTDWALALLRNGRPDEAVDMLQRINGHYRKVAYADPQLIARAKGYLAIALAEKGDDARALALFGEVVPALLQPASSDADEESLGTGRQFRNTNILEAYMALLARLHQRGEQADGRDAAAEAFRIADVARGSAVQRAVLASSARASLPDAALAELARQEQDAGQRRVALSRLLARLGSNEADTGQIGADLQRDIQRLGEEQQRLRRELASRYPDYLGLIDPRPPLPAELQAVLRADEAAVVIYLAREQAYVWSMTAQKLAFHVLPLPRARLEADTARLRSGLDLGEGRPGKFDAATAHALYRSLLAPDEAIWGGAALLNVVPHAGLGQIPFAVLLTAPGDSRGGLSKAPWLLRRVAIAQQPSASSFLSLRRRTAASAAARPFIGFGDPLFAEQGAIAPGGVRKLRLLTVPLGASSLDGEANDPFRRLAPLPDTQLELREIARALGSDNEQSLYLGRRASEGNAKHSALDGYRILAFATHGLVPGELSGLDQPALALANPRLSGDSANDGLLTLEEVIALRLDADWVVLSACNTGSADGLQNEALSGLGRGFFYAGARSLLVSNWAVDTVSARLLTTGVFRNQVANPGMTRAEALRRSMLDLMQEGRGAYAHPAFWAPFTLVGDGYR